MVLNLKATRRASLKGFATGWDDCYVTVEVVGREEGERMTAQVEALKESNDEKGLQAFLGDYLAQHIVGGIVINTNEDGTQSPYEFSRDEAREVIDFFNYAWQIEMVLISTGADRLK